MLEVAGFSVPLLATYILIVKTTYGYINDIFLAELLLLLALPVIDITLDVVMQQVMEDRIVTVVLAVQRK